MHPVETVPGRLLIILSLIVSNIEVSEFIRIPLLVGGNHSKPVPYVVLLEELLRQVLEISVHQEEGQLCN